MCMKENVTSVCALCIVKSVPNLHIEQDGCCIQFGWLLYWRLDGGWTKVGRRFDGGFMRVLWRL